MTKVIDKAYLQNFEGNELTVLRIHDAIRNFNEFSFDFAGTFEKDFLLNHNFSKADEVLLEEDVLYNISFTARKQGYLARGNLYISKTDFAIYKMEYTLYDTDKNKARDKKNKHGNKHKPIFDVTIDYVRLNEKMYPNYISFSNNFQLNLPPKFNLDEVEANARLGYFILRFNNTLDSVTALKKDNYRAFFDQQKIEIEKIKLFGNWLALYPAIKRDSLNTMMRKLDSVNKAGVFSKEIFDITVSGIEDIDGNLVNEIHVEEYEQFREFFVQRVKPESRAPFDDLFMNKRIPIFKNQPIARSKDMKEYWMNTPLQHSEQ